MTNIEKSVLSTLCAILETDVTKDMSLRDDLCMDSLDTLMLVDALEEQFDARLSEESFQGYVTVADIIKKVIECTQTSG